MSIIRYIPAVLANLGVGNATRFKNRIINGDMRIDQRNAGASITPVDTQYSLDRWICNLSAASKYSVQQNAASVTPPVGFTNYLGVTSLSSYTVSSSDSFSIGQIIEGLNVQDLAWGTASAKTVTLSFWVRSSNTGTFGGAISNSAFNRSYPFTYSISSTATWTQISVTIPGDTSGTWLTTNGIGLRVYFGLGVGTTNSGTASTWAGAAYVSATGAQSVVATNGQTLFVTGVQLEVGNSASGFEYVDYGTQLAMCQRYFEKSYSQSVAVGTNGAIGIFYAGYNANYATSLFPTYFAIDKRTTPTMTPYSGTGVSGQWYDGVLGNVTATFAGQSTRGGGYITLTSASSGIQYGNWTASSEL